MVFEARPAGEIDDDAGQRLIQRHIGMAIAAYAFLVTQRLSDGLTQYDAHVFHRVVIVNMGVALGCNVA